MNDDKKYGLLSNGHWWKWFEDGKFTDRLSLSKAQEACAMLNMAREQTEAYWEVKIIGNNGLARDLPEEGEGTQ